MKKLTQDKWIEKCNEIHGGKYDYSLVEYKSARGKVDVICHEKDEFGREHGVFSIRACNHSSGTGCPKCGRRVQATREDFIEKARRTHGNKYDYSKLEYTKSTDKVYIICPKHGGFWQNAASHISGAGCPKCAIEGNAAKKRMTTDTFVEKAAIVHNGRYDYSKSEYVGTKTKVCIICPEHGEFWMTPNNHLSGQGCPSCKNKETAERQALTLDDFVKKARDIHGPKYDYTKSEYVGYQEPLKIICPIHGEFWQTPDNHIHGSGCPKCGAALSKSELEIVDMLKSHDINVIEHDRKVLDGMELDILLPEHNLAIEYNGIYWHSERKNRSSHYHLDKLNLANKHGVKLIHIFEDEYLGHKQIVLSKIRHMVGLDGDLPKVNGRDCKVGLIDKDTARKFLDTNHIQGFVNSTVYIGAFHEDTLVAVMCFRKDSKNNWELTRFATDITKRVPGIGGKMFKFFTLNYKYREIKSFADRRWTVDMENNFYTKIGFTLDKVEKPDYRYVVGKERKHKFLFRKQILHKKYGLPLSMTERQMCDHLGFYRIWDCGLVKYVYRNPNI